MIWENYPIWLFIPKNLIKRSKSKLGLTEQYASFPMDVAIINSRINSCLQQFTRKHK